MVEISLAGQIPPRLPAPIDLSDSSSGSSSSSSGSSSRSSRSRRRRRSGSSHNVWINYEYWSVLVFCNICPVPTQPSTSVDHECHIPAITNSMLFRVITINNLSHHSQQHHHKNDRNHKQDIPWTNLHACRSHYSHQAHLHTELWQGHQGQFPQGVELFLLPESACSWQACSRSHVRIVRAGYNGFGWDLSCTVVLYIWSKRLLEASRARHVDKSFGGLRLAVLKLSGISGDARHLGWSLVPYWKTLRNSKTPAAPLHTELLLSASRICANSTNTACRLHNGTATQLTRDVAVGALNCCCLSAGQSELPKPAYRE